MCLQHCVCVCGSLVRFEAAVLYRQGVPIRRATQKSDSSRFWVSGFGFRVSSIETNFRCRFRVSGFGFRRLKPTFAVGFGFRVSIGPGEVKSSESVSGFGFRVSGFDRSWGR